MSEPKAKRTFSIPGWLGKLDAEIDSGRISNGDPNISLLTCRSPFGDVANDRHPILKITGSFDRVSGTRLRRLLPWLL